MAYNYKLHVPESMAHVLCIPCQLSDATDTSTGAILSHDGCHGRDDLLDDGCWERVTVSSAMRMPPDVLNQLL